MPEKWEDYTVAELKDFLRSKNLPVSGIKAELIDRLRRNENCGRSEVWCPRQENPERTDNTMQRELELLRRERDVEKREKEALQQKLERSRREQPGSQDARGSVKLENAVQPSSTQSSVVSSVEGNAHSSTPTNIEATTFIHLRKIYHVLITACTAAVALDSMPEIPDDAPPEEMREITRVMRLHINRLNVPDISTEISSIIISKMGRKRREAWNKTRASRNPEIEDILKFLET